MSSAAEPAAAASSKLCLCQLCTCPERLHKCVYQEGDEHLRRASVEHCRSCGCAAKRTKPYVPMGPMETATTYNSEYQAKSLPESGRTRKLHQSYVRPGAPMEDATTYNADFPGWRQDNRAGAARPGSSYKRPMGDMILETTYGGDFQRKAANEARVLYKPAGYQRPMGPMNLDTTYAAEFTEKRLTVGGFKVCCPCCDPRAHGFLPQGEENGHAMFTRRA